jgi:branched-chain amino acid transport system ATP-binding protein
MLVVEELHVFHGEIHALRGVSLHVGEGELVAIIGANGVGKSTLLGALAGIYKPARGKIVWDEKDITRLPAEKVVRWGISLVPERRQMFDTLSLKDNLLLGAYHRYRRDRAGVAADAARVLEMFPALAGKEKVAAGSLSGGMQQMLAIGRGLMARPRLLMLDEPSLGLAPLVVREIMATLARLREEGTTILLVEQNAHAALKIAGRVYILERGQVSLEGAPDQLRQDRQVQRAYLRQTK